MSVKFSLGTSVESSEITNGTIVNADVNAAAAIEQSKIANLTTDLAAKNPIGSEQQLDGNPGDSTVGGLTALGGGKKAVIIPVGVGGNNGITMTPFRAKKAWTTINWKFAWGGDVVAAVNFKIYMYTDAGIVINATNAVMTTGVAWAEVTGSSAYNFVANTIYHLGINRPAATGAESAFVIKVWLS